MDEQPTVFHITHIKSGSQWIAEILKHSAPDRFVEPRARLAHVLEDPIIPGKVYPTVYVPRSGFELIQKRMVSPCRAFVVVRDLRDTLVSLYYSMAYSHSITNAHQRRVRERLRSVDTEGGLLHLIGNEADHEAMRELFALAMPERFAVLAKPDTPDLPLALSVATIAEVQLSWVDSEFLTVRYEDLVEDEYAVFENIIDYCGIDVARERLHDIIRYNTFEAVTGRRRGQEDPGAHQRKGIVGDWRTHFTDRVKARFKAWYGHVLIRTGYVQDFNW